MSKTMPGTHTRSVRWLFVHDHHFVAQQDFVGSRNGFSSALWDRYLRHCDHLTVIGRQGPSADREDLVKSSHPDVTFKLVAADGRGLRRLLGSAEQNAILTEEIGKADVIVARVPSILGFQAIAIAKRIGKPIAIEAVGCAWSAMWDHGTRAGKVFAPIHWLQMRKALRQANNVIYVTNRFLQDRYPTGARNSVSASDDELNVAVASNVEVPAVMDQNGEPSLDQTILEARLSRIGDLNGRKLQLGLIGSLKIRSKGIQFVLQALPALRDQGIPVHFRVLGAGDPAPWIAEAMAHGVADLVSFDGALPEGEAVFQWLDGVDLYLQPSLQEGLPRALIEALSRACPAIGSSCAGIPELLDPAMIVPMRDVEALRRRIAALAGDRDEMRRQAKRNFATAQDYLSPILAERREAFFNKVGQSA